MSYTIIRSNGTVLTTIPDGTVNTTSTSFDLPGRNFPSYGQLVNTNFIQALENFANTAPPENPIRGQLWFNTSSQILHICPTDGETNPANWFPILSPNTINNLTLGNLTANSNVVANNVIVLNDLISEDIIANNLSVTSIANIATGNIQNAEANVLTTRNITSGTISTTGNITGAWNHEGSANIDGFAGTSVRISGGNLVVADPSLQVGIRTNNYMWANGQAVSFDGTYTNANVQSFLPTFVGNIGAVGSLTTFNGRLLTTGANTTTGSITGTWTLTAGSTINGISNVAGANVTGTVANANAAVTAQTATVAGTVTNASQPNITSVGTLTNLSVGGNIVAANITSSGVFTGNGAGLTNIPIANLVGTFPTVPTATQANAANTAQTVTFPNQPNITSTGTLTGLTVSGNVQFSGQIANLGQVANLRILGGAPGHFLSTNGAGVLTWQSAAAAQTAIAVTANAQPNITSVGTLTSLNVTGQITAGSISAPAGTIIGAALGGSLITAAHPNVTSLGTLTSLSVSGNVTFNGPVITLGTVGNLRITGGTPGQILTSQGGGSVTWANSPPVAQTVSNSSQPNITSVGTLTSLNVSGNITGGNINATGRFNGDGSGITNLQGASVVGFVPTASAALVAGTVSGPAQPNITSVGTLSALTVGGTASINNLVFNSASGTGSGITGINASNITSGTLNSSRLSGTYNINISGTAAAANFATTAGTANSASFATNAGTASVANDATRAGTVTVSIQPNITSIGTLTSLNVSGQTVLGPAQIDALNVINGLFRNGSPITAISDFANGPNWTRMPNGLLVQWGSGVINTNGSFVNITYPIAYTSSATPVVSGAQITTADGQQANPGVISASNVGFTVYQGRGAGLVTFFWIAVGI